jgi:pyruvate/2-oxoglutarate dehydrogenase complex dihydrolipoamide dehydrogenase (E3) component
MFMSHVARALEIDETRGFMKAIIDAKSQQILGAAVLGIEGGELMSIIEPAANASGPVQTTLSKLPRARHSSTTRLIISGQSR